MDSRPSPPVEAPEGRAGDGPDPEGMAFLADQYRLHADRVFRRCLALGGGDRSFAEDVTQDVFLRLHEKQDTIERSGAMESWLLTVADRLCLDRLRRERTLWGRVRAALTAAPPPPVRPPGGEGLLMARLGQSLEALPERERAVMLMKYVEGESQRAIAARLSCTEGYVSKLLSRAVDRLREMGWEANDG
jgi:RNA polymerase sigma factor (sigma-70 family)